MDPARVQGFEVQTRFGTRLQSYIRPACGRQMKPWALMDFRALLPISRAASDGHGC